LNRKSPQSPLTGSVASCAVPMRPASPSERSSAPGSPHGERARAELWAAERMSPVERGVYPLEEMRVTQRVAAKLRELELRVACVMDALGDSLLPAPAPVVPQLNAAVPQVGAASRPNHPVSPDMHAITHTCTHARTHMGPHAYTPHANAYTPHIHRHTSVHTLARHASAV
jgi:hypothetical protein